MWSSRDLFVVVLIAILSGGADAKNTGKPFTLGPGVGEKFVFVPKDAIPIAFNLELGQPEDYNAEPKFSLYVAGQKLDITTGKIDATSVFFMIKDSNNSAPVQIANPSNLLVLPNTFIINGTGSNIYDSKNPVQLEVAKDEKDAQYFSIKLEGGVPPKFTIDGIDVTEYIIEEPGISTGGPSKPTVKPPSKPTVKPPSKPTGKPTTPKQDETTDSDENNGRKTVSTLLNLGLAIGFIVSNVLFAQCV